MGQIKACHKNFCLFLVLFPSIFISSSFFLVSRSLTSDPFIFFLEAEERFTISLLQFHSFLLFSFHHYFFLLSLHCFFFPFHCSICFGLKRFPFLINKINMKESKEEALLSFISLHVLRFSIFVI